MTGFVLWFASHSLPDLMWKSSCLRVILFHFPHKLILIFLSIIFYYHMYLASQTNIGNVSINMINNKSHMGMMQLNVRRPSPSPSPSVARSIPSSSASASSALSFLQVADDQIFSRLSQDLTFTHDRKAETEQGAKDCPQDHSEKLEFFSLLL